MVSLSCGGILSHTVFPVGELHLKTVKSESSVASAKGMSFLQLTLEGSLCSFTDIQGKSSCVSFSGFTYLKTFSFTVPVLLVLFTLGEEHIRQSCFVPFHFLNVLFFSA